MNDFVVSNSLSPSPAATPSLAPLFMWRGAEIVLFGAFENGRWVLARGWLAGDRLEHVRRWSFAQPIPFSRQVRRLVMEALDDPAVAREQGLRALGWAEARI